MGEGRLMAELRAAGGFDHLPPQDRARAQRLTLDTLRWMERADRVLSKHLRKTPPPHVRNILRLGTTELCLGGAAHGVVDAAVTLAARHKKHNKLKGLVNAVLRKVAATGSEEWSKLRTPRLPKWLRGPLAEAWSPQTMSRIEAAHAAGAPLDLSVKSDPQAWAQTLGGCVLPTGSVRLTEAGQVSALPGFEGGDWWVQDAAAALPAQLLNAQADEQVLDLCAAPGGKTLQLASAGAQVTAVDNSAKRLKTLEENLSRTRLKADVQCADVFDLTGAWDAILLDAPCSATGTIRRHPDLPFAKDGSEFAALIDMQTAMIDHAWGLLKPGGRLVFCTCSLLPDEGEVQIEEALTRHADMQAVRPSLQSLEPAWIDDLNGLRLRPDYWPKDGGMDGFYVAVLRKA